MHAIFYQGQQFPKDYLWLKQNGISNKGSHLHFKPACLYIIYQALAILKSHTYYFHKYISIGKSLVSKATFKFSNAWCYSKRNWKRYGKNISNGTEINENITDTRIEI